MTTINYSTQLYRAAKSGDLSKLREAVLSGFDVSGIIDISLVEAAANNHKNIVEYLLTSSELKVHADINFDDNRPFNWAILNGSIEVAQYLFDKGIDAKADNHYAFRNLYESKNTHSSIYVKLFELAANDIMTNSEIRESFIHWAIEINSQDMFLLSVLAEEDNKKLNQYFIELITSNKSELAQILINKGVDINLNEALVEACKKNAKNSITLLVESGADIHCSGQEIEKYHKDGIVVYKEVNGEMVEDESQIVINKYEYEKDAPFIVACRYAPEMILYFLQKEEEQLQNKKIEEYSFDKLSTLQIAMYYGLYKLVKYLEDKGIDLKKEVNNSLNAYVSGLYDNGLYDNGYHVDNPLSFLELFVELEKDFSDPQISFSLIHYFSLVENKEAIEYVVKHGANLKNFYEEYLDPQGCTCSGDYYIEDEMENWIKDKLD